MNVTRVLLTLALLPATAAAVEMSAVLPLPYTGHAGHPAPDAHALPLDCVSMYSDTTNSMGYQYGVAVGNTVMDDLHMAVGGWLCSFDVGCDNDTGGPVDVTVTFYGNDAGDTAPAAVVAGPFLLESVPIGISIVHFETAPDNPLIPADVWMGVSFSAFGAALLIYDPPTDGASHDVFYLTPPGGTYWFGGNPVANFCLKVECEPDTAVEPATWGTVKAMYR